MKILLIEPYHSGSHAAWAEGYAHHSRHQIELLTLSGRFWKWRMHGGAVTLARQFLERGLTPDLILATDMLDVTTFLALTRHRLRPDVPLALYFHENQLAYPWSPTDRDVAYKRDRHYGFINYVSALAADRVLFNSGYNLDSFLEGLPNFLKHFPDYNELESVAEIRRKSEVLTLGLDLRRFDPFRPLDTRLSTDAENRPPLILWAHRWEHDKNPAEFFRALNLLSERGLSFELAVLGENFSQKPTVFLEAQQQLASHIVQFGYADRFVDYARWLWRADILPVTSQQDFFGGTVVEACYCDTLPLLPRRLAYPYVISATDYPACFYDDFDDLVNRLALAIQNIEQTRQVSLRSAMAQYDWQVVGEKYDRLFEGMVSGCG